MFKPVFVVENVLVVLYSRVTTQSLMMAASTSFASTNTSVFRKRSNPPGSDDDGPHFKASRDSEYYYVLEPESEPPTDEDPESIYSVQDKPTDSAKDTSDLSYSDDSNVVYTIGGDAGHTISPAEEYEPASLSEQEFVLPGVLSSASDSEHTQIVQTVSCELVKSLAANDEDTWADSSSSECEPEIDPELSLRDYWSCVQCKATNNNPLFRYCEKCFKVRKNFFPPRPKIKNNKKKKKKRNKQRLCHNDKINKNENKCNELLLLDNSNQNISGQSLVNYKNLSSSFSVESDSKTDNLINDFTESRSQNLNDLSSANINEEINISNSDLSIKSNLSTSSTVKLNNSSYYTSSSSSGVVDMKKEISSSNDNSNINSDLSNNVSFKSKTVQCSLMTSNNNYTSQLCETCLSRPKDGIFVHGRKIGHMFCCYQCSKKVWRDTGRCPLCNCKISQVLKVIS